ncbi:unnamed protein product [Durusdinium trenchii]|uniref:Peptidase S74 domain-containing protein n=1 Tax=Durusdinium trenchii TaxID=1381693 RepID=A0ABP0RZH8_9DINO
MGYACSDLALAGADTACLGVLLLVRGISRLGSPSSLLGTGRSGSSILALDFGHLEFSMLLHGFSRVGALLPALGFTNSELSALLHSVQCCGFSMLMLNFAVLGPSLALRSFAHSGSSSSASGQVHFTYTNTYVTAETSTTNQLQFYVNNQRSLTLIQKPTGASTGNVGGALHGLWYADHMLHISDRRLKKSISSLADDLDKRGQAAGIRQGSGRGAAWLLRQLRPVSYYFKRDVEAKHQRFGFIADEIAVTLPEVVQESSDEKKIKGIAYQDLIAVMVVSVQSLNSRFDEVEGLAAALMSRLVALEENVKMKKLQDWQTVMNRLENLEARLTKLEMKGLL